MRSVPSLSQWRLNCSNAGPKRARSRAYVVGVTSERLGCLIDAIIVRMTKNGVDRRVIAAMLGLDPPVVEKRLNRITPRRRKYYESHSLADMASVPEGWTASKLPDNFMRMPKWEANRPQAREA